MTTQDAIAQALNWAHEQHQTNMRLAGGCPEGGGLQALHWGRADAYALMAVRVAAAAGLPRPDWAYTAVTGEGTDLR